MLQEEGLGSILRNGLNKAQYCVWEEDFLPGFDLTDLVGQFNWTANGVGATVPAVADLKDEAFGVLAINTAGTADDAYITGQTNHAWIVPTTNKRILFKTRFNMRSATQSEFWVGVHDLASTAAGTIVDGWYFRKDDGDTNIDFVYELADTAVSHTAIHTLVADVDVELAFEWLSLGTGKGQLWVYVDGKPVSGLNGLYVASGATAAACGVGIAVKNGEGAAAIMDMDYIGVAVER